MAGPPRRRHRRSAAPSLAALAVALLSAPAWAAALRVQAPAGCVDADDLRSEVSDLINRPLETVNGIDFDVDIGPAARRGWRLRIIVTRAPDKGPSTTAAPNVGTRELFSGRCADLGEAAATAIAISVQALESDPVRPPPAARPGLAADADPPPPAAVSSAPVTPPLTPPPVRWMPRVAAAVVGDAGALPHPALGVEVSGSVGGRHLRLTLAGTLFAPESTSAAGGTGGRFSLAAGALLGCWGQPFSSVGVLVCGGIELGRMTGEGSGVTRPRLGVGLWDAARAEVGAGIPVSPRVTLAARLGATAPFTRPRFVIDGTSIVHRATPATVRGGLAVEIGF